VVRRLLVRVDGSKIGGRQGDWVVGVDCLWLLARTPSNLATSFFNLLYHKVPPGRVNLDYYEVKDLIIII
jgi:hypothetical protein